MNSATAPAVVREVPAAPVDRAVVMAPDLAAVDLPAAAAAPAVAGRVAVDLADRVVVVRADLAAGVDPVVPAAAGDLAVTEAQAKAGVADLPVAHRVLATVAAADSKASGARRRSLCANRLSTRSPIRSVAKISPRPIIRNPAIASVAADR